MRSTIVTKALVIFALTLLGPKSGAENPTAPNASAAGSPPKVEVPTSTPVPPGTKLPDLFWASDYNAALAQAKKEHRRIFAMLTEKTCGWSAKFEADTLIDMSASPIAKHKGQAPTAWNISDARGVNKDVSLAEYKGKWVLVDFFAWWCGPCVAQSLPRLIEFYDLHKDQRDKFEILAVHVDDAKDFAEYDEKIKDAKKRYWNNKELPFPLLLDATHQTGKSFGLRAIPTTILIDPDGNLVGEADEEELEKKLPPIPVAGRVAKALDAVLMFGTVDEPLDKFTTFLSKVSRIDIHFDENALKTANISPSIGDNLDLVGALTLRGWLNFVLDGLDLTFTPDDKGILITTKNPKAPVPELSAPQKLCTDRIRNSLKEKMDFAFEETALAEVCQSLEELTGKNFGIDPKARKAGLLAPTTKVSGAAKGLPLEEGLRALLDPSGLTFEVRDEVVVIVAKRTSSH